MSEPIEPQAPVDTSNQPTDDDDYRIGPEPEQNLSAWDEAIQRKMQEELERGRHFAPVEMDDEPVRYTVRDLLFLTGIAAIVFGISRTLPRGMVAGILGALALLWLIGLSLIKPQHSIFQVAWWVLMLMYLITTVAAVMGVG